MKPIPLLLFLMALLPAGLFGQSSDGLMTPWDFKKTIENLTSYSAKLTPLLDGVKPEDWRGAPEGYANQQKLIKTQLESITVLLKALAKDPERLPAVLDLFFRYENFDITLASLLEGVRRYQNPAVAELITGLRNENAPARQGLKDYMVELATNKDQEFRIVDQEAQRCRGQILKQAPKRN
jgi:hypothetical protein